MQAKEITQLKDAIRAEHGCESLYVKTIHVPETVEGVMASHGLVMVFELVGHPTAELCYAWSSRDGDQTRLSSALELHPIVSGGPAIKDGS